MWLYLSFFFFLYFVLFYSAAAISLTLFPRIHIYIIHIFTFIYVSLSLSLSRSIHFSLSIYVNSMTISGYYFFLLCYNVRPQQTIHIVSVPAFSPQSYSMPRSIYFSLFFFCLSSLLNALHIIIIQIRDRFNSNSNNNNNSNGSNDVPRNIIDMKLSRSVRFCSRKSWTILNSMCLWFIFRSSYSLHIYIYFHSFYIRPRIAFNS